MKVVIRGSPENETDIAHRIWKALRGKEVCCTLLVSGVAQRCLGDFSKFHFWRIRTVVVLVTAC